MMFKDFDWMYARIWSYYQCKFDKPVVFKLGLPGFHIFQTAEQLNLDIVKNSASKHVDTPYLSHNWGEDIVSVII